MELRGDFVLVGPKKSTVIFGKSRPLTSFSQSNLKVEHKSKSSRLQTKGRGRVSNISRCENPKRIVWESCSSHVRLKFKPEIGIVIPKGGAEA